MCKWVCPLLFESVPHAKKRSSATYCSLALSVLLMLISMNMRRLKVKLSNISLSRGVKVSCWNKKSEVVPVVFPMQGVLLVYDITNFQSFENLEDWFSMVKKANEESDVQPVISLIGNKSETWTQTHIHKEKKHIKFGNCFIFLLRGAN